MEHPAAAGLLGRLSGLQEPSLLLPTARLVMGPEQTVVQKVTLQVCGPYGIVTRPEVATETLRVEPVVLFVTVYVMLGSARPR